MDTSRRARSFRLLLIFTAAALVVSVPPVAAEVAEEQPQIGFVSGYWSGLEKASYDVYVANADGTGLVNLTAGLGSTRLWAWSPDGSRLAFVTMVDGAGELHVRSLDASVSVPVGDAVLIDYQMGPTWSPDGDRIAYVSSRDGDADIYVADLVAGTDRNVSNDPWPSSSPRWSPTGSHLAYVVRTEDDAGSNWDLYIVSASGGAAVNVTADPARSTVGAWSPDGARFAFVTNRNGDDDIYVADADGRNAVRMTDSPANDRNPAWSPDGSQLLYSTGGVERFQLPDSEGAITPSRLWIMDADGANRRQLTDASIVQGDLTYLTMAAQRGVWSPDGTKIAVSAFVSGYGPHQALFNVFVMDSDGASTPPVEVAGGGGGFTMRWSPDGARLAISSTGNYGFDRETVVVAADGTGTRLLLTRGVGSGFAGWSPDGTLLAFENSGGAQPGDTVFVAAADGTSPLAVTAGLDAAVNSSASWRPQPLLVGLVDPASGRWHLRDGERAVTFYYGNPGDVPFMGDWDCDGDDTPGLYRQSDGYVYLRNSNTEGVADIRFFFGNPDDVPLAGDFDGDGCDTVSLYRPPEQRFYISNELGSGDGGLGAADFTFVFGNPGDTPVAGDWDGDGADEVGLHRESTGLFYWRDALTTGVADGTIVFGDPGDRLVAGDFGTADGRDTPAVFRPGRSAFYLRHTLSVGIADHLFTWPGARPAWLPVAGTFWLN